MKLSHYKLFFCPLVVALLHSSLSAFESQIKLAGRKDLVLSVESRQTVLEVGMTFIANKADEYASTIEELTDPFAFKTTALVQVGAGNTAAEATPEPVINYADADVLAASAASFAQKVRGSISRGDSNFLQLEGGNLLKPGTSFPVRIPQAKHQTFMLTITEITSQGYTLQIGEATQQLRYDNKTQPTSDSIRFSNP